jgi:hypothetical protein
MIHPDTRWMSVYLIQGNSNVARHTQNNNLPLVLAQEAEAEKAPPPPKYDSLQAMYDAGMLHGLPTGWRIQDGVDVDTLLNDPRTKKL